MTIESSCSRASRLGRGEAELQPLALQWVLVDSVLTDLDTKTSHVGMSDEYASEVGSRSGREKEEERHENKKRKDKEMEKAEEGEQKV